MRFVPLLLLVCLLTLPSSALAQKQEMRGSERIMRKATDPEVQKMEFDTRQASFSGGRTFNSKSANSKSFGFKQKFAATEFRSKEFAGSKSAWMGDFKFSSRKANTSGKYAIPNATRQATTKTMEVADARESSKGMPAREFSKANRPYLGPEADRIKNGPVPAPAGWIPGFGSVEVGGNLKEMTIDDIRELLNKNK